MGRPINDESRIDVKHTSYWVAPFRLADRILHLARYTNLALDYHAKNAILGTKHAEENSVSSSV